MASPHHRACGSAHGGSGQAIRLPPSHDMAQGPHPRHPMLPIGSALIGDLIHSDVIGTDILSVVGYQPTSSALPRTSRLPVVVFTRASLSPRLAVPVLWRLLTSQGISSPGSPQIRACCFPARPPHLPPRLDPRLRDVVPTRRIAAGLICGFCSSAHRFPLAFLPPLGYPCEVGFT